MWQGINLTQTIPPLLSLASMDVEAAVADAFKARTMKLNVTGAIKTILKTIDTRSLAIVIQRLGVDDGGIELELTQAQGSEAEELHCAFPAEMEMTLVAGDVQIVGCKVRALLHFPTVQLSRCCLTPRSGRWYYEVQLLSEGLVQIGWASWQMAGPAAAFACDPTCGQGG